MQILILLLCCLIIGKVSAFTHIVGGANGWRVPDNLTYYEEWAKPRTFGVGDRIVFPSRPMGNNVVEVSKEDFGPCKQEKVKNMYFEGPLILNLTHTGDYYFYSGVGKHCEAGQKLHITVGTKQGSSGDLSPFKLFTNSGDDVSTTTATSTPAQLQHDVKVKVNSATTIQNIAGISFGLLTFSILQLI